MNWEVTCPDVRKFIMESDMTVDEYCKLSLLVIRHCKDTYNQQESMDTMLKHFLTRLELLENKYATDIKDTIKKSIGKQSVDKLFDACLDKTQLASIKQTKEITDAIAVHSKGVIRDVISEVSKNVELNEEIKETLDSLETDISTHIIPFKAENSSVKGTEAEKRFEYMLNSVLGYGYSILNVSKSGGGKGDLLVKYMDKTLCPILVEVKMYTKSDKVPTEEVTKLHNDMRRMNLHGIMVSVDKEITYKKSWLYEKIPGTDLYALYISRVGLNDVDKVIVAMNIIQALNNTLKEKQIQQFTQISQVKLTPTIIKRCIDIVDDECKLVESMKKRFDRIKKEALDGIKELKVNSLLKITSLLSSALKKTT